jgi:hypothetical protein
MRDANKRWLALLVVAGVLWMWAACGGGADEDDSAGTSSPGPMVTWTPDPFTEDADEDGYSEENGDCDEQLLRWLPAWQELFW